MNKTEVMNDSLGQPTIQAGSDCRLILKFWTLYDNSDHYLPGLWSASWINWKQVCSLVTLKLTYYFLLLSG